MILERRKVGFKTILDLLKQKPRQFSFGISLSIIPFIFVGLIHLIFILDDFDVPKVDYKLIKANGIGALATIKSIEIQSNTSINGEHPRIISYTYKSGEQLIDDKFRVLDSVKVSNLEIGDTIQIKIYDGQTIILDLEPYDLQKNLFFLILSPFLIIGLIILGLLYWRIKGQIDLYKYGKVTNAEIVSMAPISGFRFSGIEQIVRVHYQYYASNGQKLLGESLTTDYTILTSKKQGEAIKIFVSPEKETKSCVFSKLDEIRNNWKIE